MEYAQVRRAQAHEEQLGRVVLSGRSSGSKARGDGGFMLRGPWWLISCGCNGIVQSKYMKQVDTGDDFGRPELNPALTNSLSCVYAGFGLLLVFHGSCEKNSTIGDGKERKITCRGDHSANFSESSMRSTYPEEVITDATNPATFQRSSPCAVFRRQSYSRRRKPSPPCTGASSTATSVQEQAYVEATLWQPMGAPNNVL